MNTNEQDHVDTFLGELKAARLQGFRPVVVTQERLEMIYDCAEARFHKDAQAIKLLRDREIGSIHGIQVLIHKQ